jgi:type IX secretion system PorP/SprF family membrane protein
MNSSISPGNPQSCTARRVHSKIPYLSEPLGGRKGAQPAENQRNKMIRNVILGWGLITLGLGQLSAQQDPQLTQWFNDPAAFNIGAAGESDLTHVNAWYRNQWMGVNGAPVTTMLNVHSNVDFIPGALGVQVYQDEIGQESNTMVKLGYAYHLSPLSNGAHVGVGLNVSLFSKSFDADWIVSTGTPAEDPAIPTNGASGTSTDIDFGVFLRKGKDYYAGLSMTHLAEVQMSSLNIVPTRHYYFMGGYNYALNGEELVLRSNLMAKSDLNATSVDVNVNVLYNDFVWGGLSYRHGDAIAPMAGVQYEVKNKEGISSSTQVFKLGYSFDATTSELRSYSTGSHELFLSYCFKFITTPVENKYANPRIL